MTHAHPPPPPSAQTTTSRSLSPTQEHIIPCNAVEQWHKLPEDSSLHGDTQVPSPPPQLLQTQVVPQELCFQKHSFTDGPEISFYPSPNFPTPHPRFTTLKLVKLLKNNKIPSSGPITFVIKRPGEKTNKQTNKQTKKNKKKLAQIWLWTDSKYTYCGLP